MATNSQSKFAKVIFTAYDQKHEIFFIGCKSDEEIIAHCKSITETSIVHDIDWYSNDTQRLLRQYNLN
jgi:hypothetical protein